MKVKVLLTNSNISSNKRKGIYMMMINQKIFKEL